MTMLPETMNIWAVRGHKVRPIYINNQLYGGYESQQQRASKFLEPGKEYTVMRTDVHQSSTSVYLEEFPNESFNSVHFEDVASQSPDKDALHPDYRQYC